MNNNENLVQRLTDAVMDTNELAARLDFIAKTACLLPSSLETIREAADAIRAHLPAPDGEAVGAGIAHALERYFATADAVGGCSDGSCVVKRPAGMHTNGGCKCWKDQITAQRMMRAGEALAKAVKDALAHPAQHSDDAGRVAELEAQLAAVTRDRDIFVESFNERTDRIAELEALVAAVNARFDRISGDNLSRIAALESQLTESREREAKLIADLDANLEAFSDERKRALSAENLARELHELLADYVSQDSIAQGYGAGIGGTTYEKAEAFLDALAAEKE